MHHATRRRTGLGALAVLAVLVAAPGVHLFERWLAPVPALWVSHGLAASLLVAVIWRWRAARRRASTASRRAS